MTLARPFPAVVFESVSVAATPVLPRMDIAAFVGFASSGPLHTPIAIEDPAEFREVFGEPRVRSRAARGAGRTGCWSQQWCNEMPWCCTGSIRSIRLHYHIRL